MGTVTRKYNYGYNKKALQEELLLIYKNTSNQEEYVKSVTIGLGVAGDGVKYTAGDSVTGNGKARIVTLSYKNTTTSSIVNSNSQTVNNTVGRNYSSNDGYYPDYEDCSNYTFEFDEAITVLAGKTINININAADNDSVLVFNKKSTPIVTLSDGKTQNKTPCIIFVNGEPKNAIPYICINGEWIVATPKLYKDGQWI